VRWWISLWAFTNVAAAADLQGLVLDAAAGEPLARISVRGCGADTSTDAQGRFRLPAPGEDCALRVAGVGYRPVTLQVRVSDPLPELEVALHPDTLRQSESVDVVAAPFAGEEGTAVGLAGNELRNLASVLADDPLRAVQSLPGVTSNDDFQSQFAVRAAGIQRTGIYLDGVLLHSPFHTLQGDATSASLSVVEGEVLESATLYPSALPPMYADRTAGALDFRTREGDRRQFGMRGTGSASNAGLTAEGPLGRKGSWLAAARKSYLQYIIERTADDPTLGFGFWDAQGKAAYSLTAKHHLSLSVTDGHSGLDRTTGQRQFGLNTIIEGDYHFTLASLAWRWAPSPRLYLTNRAGWMRERFENVNRNRTPIAGGGYGEWLWNADGSYSMSSGLALSFGASIRRVRDDGFFDRLFNPPAPSVPVERHRGAGVRSGGYVQQSWSPGERLQLIAGGRVDRHDINGVTSVSPYAGAAVGLWEGARIHLNWGQGVQYPEIAQFFSLAGSRRLLPERATHAMAALEQRLGDRTRLRAEAYQRQDRDLLFRPSFDPRLEDGQVVVPPAYPPWTNSLRGWARGFQVFLQRRAANNLTGWIAYAYGRSWVRDGVTGNGFPADYDQRHSVRVFSSYRLRPTINLSGKWIWGSGLPVRGYFQQGAPTEFFLSEDRNRLRLPNYQRVDVRVNKAFLRAWGQITLFAEVINLTNRRNVRFDDLNSYNISTRRASLSFESMFPILPSAGVVIDF
jgi:hypothetical protein